MIMTMNNRDSNVCVCVHAYEDTCENTHTHTNTHNIIHVVVTVINYEFTGTISEGTCMPSVWSTFNNLPHKYCRFPFRLHHGWLTVPRKWIMTCRR